jgi:site-specific recombinase XerD
MKNSTFSICFFIKRSKLLKSGKAPLFMRITINGNRWETSMQVGVESEKWDSNKEKARGSDRNSIMVNDSIDNARYRVQKIKLKNEQEGKLPTLANIRYLFQDRQRIDRTIIKLFNEHNKNCVRKIGTQMAKATYERYLTCLKHFQDFLRTEYGIDDLPICDIDKDIYERFELYLRTEKKCTNNTTVKYIRNFNKIVRIAVDKGWISSSPYKEIGFKIEEIDKPCLSQIELDNLGKKEITLQRLDLIRDVFIFCCYSGLAFSDVKELTEDNIIIGIDNHHWINKHRKKTNVMSKIPLLSVAETLIKKYKENPICIVKGVLLPVPSNQKMNAYLKEIADICGIKKTLTTHTARRTFATTVMLHNGVNMEAVSKMLGHTSLFMTRKYAKVDELYISLETKGLEEKIRQVVS